MAIFNSVYKSFTPKTWNWDLSKAISSNRTQFSLWNYSYEISLSEDGTKLFVSWTTSTTDSWINVYPLSTPFDITTTWTATTYGNWSARLYPNACMADNWNKLFIWYGTGSSTYARYDLWTAYDLSNIDFTSPDDTFTMTADLWIMSVSADGKNFIYRPWTARSLTYAVSSTAREPVNSQTALLSSSNVMSGTFCNEWKMLMVMDGTTIKKYELWTPYDLTTLNTTPIQSQSTGLGWNPWGIYVDKYGDNIYISINNVLYRYNLV